MGWAIWNKEMSEEFQNAGCEYCENPMALGDKYYILDDTPLRVGHAECVWKAVDEAVKKKGL